MSKKRNYNNRLTINYNNLGTLSHRELIDALMDDIHIIDSSLQYINDLLRNMLDIHRTQHKKMKLDVVPTDILKDIFERASNERPHLSR